MKKRMPKIYVLILILLFVLTVLGCGEVFRTEVNKSPDDDVSEAICEAVGRKKVYYHGKQYNNSGKVA